jgi:hypothetical protein
MFYGMRNGYYEKWKSVANRRDNDVFEYLFCLAEKTGLNFDSCLGALFTMVLESADPQPVELQPIEPTVLLLLLFLSILSF